jgi:hypothetical protein
MKTAMQELIEKVEHAISYNVEGGLVEKYTWTELFNDMELALKKEKKQITSLIDALEDIKNWDDDLEVEWGDCGERAIYALKIFKENK